MTPNHQGANPSLPAQAMLLAAGLGTRLRPHTLTRPKPLFPVLGRPLLLWLLDALRRAGLTPVVVNAFHLREQIAELLAKETDVVIQMEETVLGTGGGLRLAQASFGAQPVLVSNGDIFHTIDYAWVYEQHLAAGNDATLVLHDYPRFNQVAMADDQRIIAFGEEVPGRNGGGPANPSHRLLAFTGIQVIDPALLALIPPGIFYNSIDWYRELIRRGCRVRALVAENHFWCDMGTPEDYQRLQQTMRLAGALGQSRERQGEGNGG